jgi:hypothetical protein
MGVRLHGSVVDREEVHPALAARLHELFTQHYTHVDSQTFDRDLERKDSVLLLSDETGAVRGFTTMKLYTVAFGGREIRAMFNGNTIIDPACWGEQELVRTWCGFMARLKMGRPDVPLYWFLICSGFRTYMYLPLFFDRFYPCHHRTDLRIERELADVFGQMVFPDEYRDGVVHVATPRECLRPELAVPRPHKLRNPHVRFFVERNPGYRRGDELVCITEFSIENNRGLARSAFAPLAAGVA